MSKEADDKKPISPTRLSTKELYDSYPTLLRRGLTEDILMNLVEWDIIGGLLPDDEGQNFIVFKDSIERFLDYQNDYYEARINAVEQNLALIKEKREQKTKNNKKGTGFSESQ